MLAPPDQPGPPWRVSPPEARATLTYALPPMREPGDGRPKAFRRVRVKDKPANYYVEGYADHWLKNADDPEAPENRRIEILIREMPT